MAKWRPDEVLEMLSNPIYTGMGPYPQIVTDKVWIKAAIKGIGEVGAEKFLTAMLKALRASLDIYTISEDKEV